MLVCVKAYNLIWATRGISSQKSKKSILLIQCDRMDLSDILNHDREL